MDPIQIILWLRLARTVTELVNDMSTALSRDPTPDEEVQILAERDALNAAWAAGAPPKEGD